MLILAFTALRIVFAMLLGFGVDESYTLGQARRLALSYFDHPPLHLWLAHASMLVFGTTWAVRLPFILMFAGTSWLMFRLTERLFGGGRRLGGAGLNCSLFFLASPGTWIVPTVPSPALPGRRMLALAQLFFPKRGETPSAWRAWALAGLCFGLAGLSKYSALFVVVGLAAFCSRRRTALAPHPAPYAGAVLAAIVVSPIIVWNMANDWASLRFQAGRGGGKGLTLSAFAQMLAGQFVWLGPWIAVPLATIAVQEARRWFDPRRLFLLALAPPTILYFTIQSLWSGWALPHWPMPGWFFLFPLLGGLDGGEPRCDPRPAPGRDGVPASPWVSPRHRRDRRDRTAHPPRRAAAGRSHPRRLRLAGAAAGSRGEGGRSAVRARRGGADLERGRQGGPCRGDAADVMVIGPDPRGFMFRQVPRAYQGRMC